MTDPQSIDHNTEADVARNELIPLRASPLQRKRSGAGQHRPGLGDARHERTHRRRPREPLLEPTVEGEATAVYLSQTLRRPKVKITRIATGIPVGSDIEYADEVTMAKAIEGRREL